MRVVAIEEHYASAVDERVPASPDALAQLRDLGDARIADMDASGPRVPLGPQRRHHRRPPPGLGPAARSPQEPCIDTATSIDTAIFRITIGWAWLEYLASAARYESGQ